MMSVTGLINASRHSFSSMVGSGSRSVSFYSVWSLSYES